MVLLDYEFVYFCVAFAVGEVNHINALRQVDANSDLVTCHGLGVQYTPVGGIDGEVGWAVAVVHYYDANASVWRIRIDM